MLTHLNHFEVYGSVLLSPHTLLYNQLPELFSPYRIEAVLSPFDGLGIPHPKPTFLLIFGTTAMVGLPSSQLGFLLPSVLP